MKRFFIGLSITLSLLFLPVHASAIRLIAGGESAGIVIRYAGVYVSGTYSFQTKEGSYDPGQHDIQVGDIIVKASGKSIQSLDDLFTAMKLQVISKDSIPISIVRGSQVMERSLKLAYNQDTRTFKTGLYVKDSISGVGTISFYNPQNKTFGALGHDIINSQTGRSAEVGTGSLYLTKVVSIRKSSKGNPGEKVADTSSFQLIGNVLKNNIYGVYGTYQNLPGSAGQALEMASQNEVRLGHAKIRTVLQQDRVEDFDIEITKLDTQVSKNVKGIQFRIIDSRLLSNTGGIVQGMSGSPIIQDGKLVGAITHVLVQKPEQGYGIYIEWMVEEANSALQQ